MTQDNRTIEILLGLQQMNTELLEIFKVKDAQIVAMQNEIEVLRLRNASLEAVAMAAAKKEKETKHS